MEQTSIEISNIDAVENEIVSAFHKVSNIEKMNGDLILTPVEIHYTFSELEEVVRILKFYDLTYQAVVKDNYIVVYNVLVEWLMN